jgi:hypothetical protein
MILAPARLLQFNKKIHKRSFDKCYAAGSDSLFLNDPAALTRTSFSTTHQLDERLYRLTGSF